MFKIYISDALYNDVVRAEEQKNFSECSDLYKMLKRQPVQLLTASDNARFKSHPEEVLKDPSALYVLDMTPVEAQTIQASYGVMCQSSQQPDVSPLIDVNDIFISNVDERFDKGWDSVLDSVERLPSNALLLTDRYLFAFRHPNAGDGLANIREILNELLPLRFQGDEYHVTVVFDDKSKHASYSFDEIATKLNRIKKQLGRAYPIMMEVLGVTPDCAIYNKLHPRLILSNYYLVEAGHKLAAFNADKGTARQTLIPMALFTESSLKGSSTPPLEAINQTVTTLRDFSDSLSRLEDHSVYLYAVNGQRQEKCMSLRNRLISVR